MRSQQQLCLKQCSNILKVPGLRCIKKCTAKLFYMFSLQAIQSMVTKDRGGKNPNAFELIVTNGAH
ncbi:hypothetical protein AVO46_17925 [Vibrio cholerae]|nr:hypothetical protein AVO46_17925 [Vibrio cholerae]